MASRLDFSDDLEKCSLSDQLMRPSNTKKSNYGSLRKESQQTSTAFIVNYRHKLMPGETLPGLSLKYGVPIENLKRANRLWSNDLAFVKDFLIVPIDKERLKELNLVYDENTKQVTSIADPNDIKVMSSNTSISNSNYSLVDALNNNQNQQDNNDKEALKDYLNRFDSFINESKLKLKSLETTSSNLNSDHHSNGYADDEDDLFVVNRKRYNAKEIDCDPNEPLVGSSSSKSTTRSKKNNDAMPRTSSKASLNKSAGSSSNNLSAIPDMVVKLPNGTKYTDLMEMSSMKSSSSSSSRARKAQETLERLEKEKDDLFEL